jgi:uncharacterized LabA/DUF88 family protein
VGLRHANAPVVGSDGDRTHFWHWLQNAKYWRTITISPVGILLRSPAASSRPDYGPCNCAAAFQQFVAVRAARVRARFFKKCSQWEQTALCLNETLAELRSSLTALVYLQLPGRSASTSITSSFSRNSRAAERCCAPTTYYTAIVEDQEYLSIRPLIDWLDYNGYTVVTKATKAFIDASGRRKVKGNMDIELAVDAMELAVHVDQIVLFSGDSDFRSLVEAVQRRGVRVTLVSTISSQPPMIADDLRRQADVFIDLMELRSRIGREPSERPLSRGTTERLLRAHGPELAEK